MFGFLKKKTNNMSCESETDKNKVAIDRFQGYLNLVNNNRFGYAPVQCEKILIKIIVEYLNYEEALQSFEKEHDIQNNSLIEEIYLKIESYLFLNKKTSYIEESMKIDINKLPILLNPWSEKEYSIIL